MVGVWSDIEWGTVGEWFSGLGGILAVGVAVWFGLAEHRRAERLGDEAQRLRVAQVTLSIVRESDGRLVAEIQNEGNLAVRDVRLIASLDGQTISREIGDLFPGGQPRLRLPFDASRRRHIAWVLEFADYSGTGWRRTPGGVVERQILGDPNV